MDDIIGEKRKKAFIPVLAGLLTLAMGIPVSWNALNGQVPNRLPSHIVEKQDDGAAGSIGDFLKGDDTDRTSAHLKFDADVELIQKTLKDQGFYAGEVDGVSGPPTEAATRAYAKENGIAGKEDLRQAVLEHIRYNRQLRKATKITPPTEDGGLSLKTVGLIQIGLSELGYDPGPVDGKVGRKTQAAIRDFQRDRALTPNGEPSDELLTELRKITGLTSLKGS